jgi:hypothetical protein
VEFQYATANVGVAVVKETPPVLVGVLAAAKEMIVVLAASAAAIGVVEAEVSVEVRSEVLGVVRVRVAEVLDETVELM